MKDIETLKKSAQEALSKGDVQTASAHLSEIYEKFVREKDVPADIKQLALECLKTDYKELTGGNTS